MIITKEDQEALISTFNKKERTFEQHEAFVLGMKAMLKLIIKKSKKSPIS